VARIHQNGEMQEFMLYVTPSRDSGHRLHSLQVHFYAATLASVIKQYKSLIANCL